MPVSEPLNFQLATAADAGPLAQFHTSVSEHLTDQYGRGPWSMGTSEKGMLLALRTSQVFIAKSETEIIGTFRLTTKKPWAIDTSYFSPCCRPLYLLSMAVVPHQQRQGIGRLCLREAKRIAKAWPADAIRLDAYDMKAGAGSFYARCGWKKRGHATYRRAPLIYFEFLL